ncbi:MAG: hypothetical protein NBV65_03375 [Burkholderiaceae bacterium]|nr:hypothetical protein [Burkholderiaceae bacterium]
MKPSLEDERRALLEQIEASRAVYRRMLAGELGAAALRTPRGTRPGLQAAAGKPTMRVQVAQSPAVLWMMDHPLWVAGGVALLVLLAPQMMGKTAAVARQRQQRKRREQRLELQREAARVPSGGTARALLTAAVLLLRDPARMRAAARVLGSAWQWLQQQRQKKTAGTVTLVTPTARATTRVH